jgi:hypothetical protein
MRLVAALRVLKAAARGASITPESSVEARVAVDGVHPDDNGPCGEPMGEASATPEPPRCERADA